MHKLILSPESPALPGVGKNIVLPVLPAARVPIVLLWLTGHKTSGKKLAC